MADPMPLKLVASARDARRAAALVTLRRMMGWIAVAGIFMVAGALWYLSLFGPITAAMAAATIFGVLVSVFLGSGLLAVGFFSANSGIDQSIADGTRALGIGVNPTTLPPGLVSYRRTDSFTQDNVPAALLADHSTKAGTWGLIHVEEGALRYRVSDPRRAPLDAILTSDLPPGVVEPTILHHVESVGVARFHVEFWREAANAR